MAKATRRMCGHAWGQCTARAEGDNPGMKYMHTCGIWIIRGQVHHHKCFFCPASK